MVEVQERHLPLFLSKYEQNSLDVINQFQRK